MLKNYLKITWAVMKRRKFYTFISLFGISLTLTILIVLTAFFDTLFAPNYPERDRERTLYVQYMQQMNTKEQGSRMGPVSRYLIDNYVSKMTTPEKIAVTSTPNMLNTYLNNRRGKLYIRYTDAAFWQVNTFDFVEGKGFTEETLRQNDNAVIITEDIRDRYFGKGVSVLGKNMDLAGDIYRIGGVIKGNTQLVQMYTAAEIYLPITADKQPIRADYNGGYFVLLLAKDKSDFPKIKAEYESIIRKLPIIKDGDFQPDTLISTAETYMRSFTRNITGGGAADGDGLSLFFTITLIFAFLFMLLPAINLVNLNISRIMERASEIGIRKAFGASAGTLTIQFIIENIIITIVGGIIALLLSSIIITYLNRYGIGSLSTLNLSINWFVLSIAFILSFVFGILSGVLPAFRMAKLPVIEALKN